MTKQIVANLRDTKKLQHEADIDVMNQILLEIPNDIYNSVNACKDAKAMWNVKASSVKRATKTHDSLALVANTYVSSLSSRSLQPYYVTHPSSVIDYDVKEMKLKNAAGNDANVQRILQTKANSENGPNVLWIPLCEWIFLTC
nr:hypothetical protein [Tanacetum cinerariifolium]